MKLDPAHKHPLYRATAQEYNSARFTYGVRNSIHQVATRLDASPAYICVLLGFDPVQFGGLREPIEVDATSALDKHHAFSATLASYEDGDPIGYGPTPEAAALDLLDELGL